MRFTLLASCAAVLIFTTTVVQAQQHVPALPSAGPAASPTWKVLRSEVVIDRPVAAVWARIGKYCDIGEIAGYPCTITSGKDGELGAVRVVDNTVELLVGRSTYSYTYALLYRPGNVIRQMHGTVEARRLDDFHTVVSYAHVYDNSELPDDAARAVEITARQGRINRALGRMKILAESVH